MTPTSQEASMPDPLDVAGLRARVQACVEEELHAQAAVLAEVGEDVEDLLASIEQLLSGGKRLRAGFLYWGYRSTGGLDSAAIVRLATAMEFFQGAALIHDDVMDESDFRRGMPAAHRALAARHAARGWDGDGDRFGVAGAILAGNLCLNWTDELYATSGLDAGQLARARPLFDRMRTQLMAGQFLDVVESARPWASLAAEERIFRARRVIRFKSAKYTIEHPLLIGLTAGAASGHDLAAMSRYGLELGEAFQLRDDLLGVFGDPAATGKPAGDDLREGKRTVLLAHALAGSSPADQQALESRLGDPALSGEQVEQLRELIAGSGAVETVEAEIAALAGSARHALKSCEGLTQEAVDVLDALVDISTARSA